MAYELDAFVAPLDAAAQLHGRLRGSTLLPMRDGLALVLGPHDSDVLDPEDIDRVLAGLTVARVEADFFGGTGTQSAWLYRDGTLAWSDVDNPTTEPDASTWPINRALAALGHRPSRPTPWNPETLLDSFSEIGLGHCRSNDDWIRFAEQGGTGETIV